MTRIRTFLVIFVVAVFLSLLLAGSRLWGLSAYRFMSINWGLLFALFVLLLMNKGIADRVADAFSSMGRIRGTIYLTTALFLLLSFLLRSKHDFWGERLFTAQSVENGFFFHPNAPLGALINYLFFRAANSIFLLTASASTSLLSIIAGGCFVIGAFSLAGNLVPGERGDRAVVFNVDLYCR